MLYLLDTDHMTFLQLQDGSEWQAIQRHLQRVGQSEVGVSVVSYHEQINGIQTKLNQAKTPTDLIPWYRRMLEMFDLYSTMNVLAFDGGSVAFVNLIKQACKDAVKPMDRRIAAIALANDLTLVTRNRSDFEKVPNLKIEDWTR
jgi:tRNA(fMet)-specific endonuclease VapC